MRFPWSKPKEPEPCGVCGEPSAVRVTAVRVECKDMAQGNAVHSDKPLCHACMWRLYDAICQALTRKPPEPEKPNPLSGLSSVPRRDPHEGSGHIACLPPMPMCVASGAVLDYNRLAYPRTYGGPMGELRS